MELRGTSGAGEYWGPCLGVYLLTKDTRKEDKRQGPVYRQLHDGDNEQCYLYRWEICTRLLQHNAHTMYSLYLSELATTGGFLIRWEKWVAD